MFDYGDWKVFLSGGIVLCLSAGFLIGLAVGAAIWKF